LLDASVQWAQATMKISSLVLPALGGLLVFGSIAGTPAPAKANTTATALIAAGAAAIVGALIYDSNNHPYHVRDNRRYYVTQEEANYYRGHHHGYVRQSYVPEREYPVARPYHHDNGNHYGERNRDDRDDHGNRGNH
jgi:hypothetical protein